jgi:outer membrane receptor protein involved in Fe transport
MPSYLRNFSVVGLTLFLMTGAAWAQATAELAGRVTDESGAVLPGVTVTVTQTDTGFTRTVATEGTGAWNMPNLPTGPYRLEVSLPGFRTYVQTGIVLQVGATPTINAVLGVGNLEETVSVEAAAPLVDVRSAGISDVVEQERIVALPLQGREVTDLIVLAGAAFQAGRPSTKGFQGGVQISVAGSTLASIAYTLDGAMHNDVGNDGGLPLPFPDALQEFQVATSGLAADKGMHAGAAVNAVTKSGTNARHGNLFEFLRDKGLNATSPFAAVGPDGKRLDDGLRRHQYGGTFGGPIARDRLFVFGGYQGTNTRINPTDNIAYVPTAAMLTGDFTTFASPACNSGRQIALRAPFVDNRVNPALFSPGALNLVAKLPTTGDPCGETKFGLPQQRDQWQAVTRTDYHVNANNSIFGRYMATKHDEVSSYNLSGGNALAALRPNIDNLAQSLTVGQTAVMGPSMVNAVRFAFNRTAVNRFNNDFFTPSDLGAKLYNNSPVRETQLAVTNGFTISQAQATKATADNNAFQVSDELTLVRGRHQIGIGANLAYWTVDMWAYSRGNGQYTYNGQNTGLGLGDFLLGRPSVFVQGQKVGVRFNQWYKGVYVQDAWRATERVTVNAGLRWEPYTGQEFHETSVAHFSHDAFLKGTKSTVFVNAPAGFSYYGDPGYDTRSGTKKQWLNLGPRAGVAWDVTGDGRLAVRTSYGLAYDFPAAETWWGAAGGPPYSNRLSLSNPPGGFDDPYATFGGSPFPLVTERDMQFIPFGLFGAVEPDNNSPRVQQWNVTVERQLGSVWGVSATYLGSHSDRFLGSVEQNPGVYMGQGPCTLPNGVSYPVCTVAGNLNERRVLSLENPKEGSYVSTLELFDDVTTIDYRGLKMSFQRRAASGVRINGNWTWGRCLGGRIARGGQGDGDPGGGGNYHNPADIDYDRGHCDYDQTHLANLTLAYQTPEFTRAVLRAVASDWQLSGIVSARSGSWLTVTTGVTGFNGLADRVDQVSDDVYGDKTLLSYLNRAAFANPAPGTFGNHPRNSIQGPGAWKTDLAVSRMFSWATGQQVEIRFEAFNLFNTFNWGNPITTLNSGNFGRIQSTAGDPRILQFGIKYGF